MFLKAALVTISTHFPYSGLAFPSISPLISLNCLRTSITISWAELPTAVMHKDEKINGNKAPMNNPTKTAGSVNKKLTAVPVIAVIS